jgi:hypothetical protein
LVGNGFCNDEANTENCNYDNGDCCGICVVTTNCVECACLDGNNTVQNILGPECLQNIFSYSLKKISNQRNLSVYFSIFE